MIEEGRSSRGPGLRLAGALRRAEDRRAAEVYRDSLTDLSRNVLVIALAVGLPAIVWVLAARGATDPLVRWLYPPVLGYLLSYAWVLVRRPQHAVRFSRLTLVLFEVAWMVGIAWQLRGAPDAQTGWQGLFPTLLMSLVIFLVVGFLFFPTRDALLNAGGVVGGVLLSGLVGLGAFPERQEPLLELVRFVIYLAIIAMLLQVLSRAKARLAVALAAVQRATDEALQMRDMAYLDPLTGLANRRRLLEELAFRAEHVSRARPVAVLYFDLDHFKEINDTHGHAVGDQVLQHVAQLTQRVVRTEDVVARLGGEEFVVVAPGTDQAQAVALAERLRVMLPEEVGAAVGVPITASFGVVALRSGESPASVLSRVDAQMYVAKRAGRDQVAPIT